MVKMIKIVKKLQKLCSRNIWMQPKETRCARFGTSVIKLSELNEKAFILKTFKLCVMPLLADSPSKICWL